jgi:hypothetical protein
MPFITLAIGAVFDRLRTRPRKALALCMLAALVCLNLSMVVLYQLELVPHNDDTFTLGELARLAVTPSAARVQDFIFSSHINENVFARRFFHAVARSRVLPALGVLAAAAATGGWLLAVAWAAGKPDRTPRTTSAHALALAALVFAAVDGCVLALPRPSRNPHVYPVLDTAYENQEAEPSVAARELRLDAGSPSRLIHVRFHRAVDCLDLTSMTIGFDDGPPDRTLVATLTLTTRTGDVKRFPVIAGIDTADITALRTPGAAPRDRAVHHWLKQGESGDYYYGAGYHQRYILNEPSVIQTIQIDYHPPNGGVVITGIHLVRLPHGHETR